MMQRSVRQRRGIVREAISLKLLPDLKLSLEQAAQANGRSASNEMEVRLVESFGGAPSKNLTGVLPLNDAVKLARTILMMAEGNEPPAVLNLMFLAKAVGIDLNKSGPA